MFELFTSVMPTSVRLVSVTFALSFVVPLTITSSAVAALIKLFRTSTGKAFVASFAMLSFTISPPVPIYVSTVSFVFNNLFRC